MDNGKGCSSGGVSGLAPLSFSLSSLSGSSSPVLEMFSPARTHEKLHTNSLNRRKTKRCSEREEARRSWGPADKEEGSREFWASIQEPYDFIMGSNLIPDSCQVGDTTEAPSSGEFELSWDSGDVSPPYVWSFSEFLDQYNELYEWLIQVQLKVYSHSNPTDKAARLAQQEELRRRTFRRKLFVEQGERVAQRYPGSAEEISWRVNYLNNKWDQLESHFTPAKGRSQEVEVELDLAHEEGLLKRWLSDMEDQIQPLTCRLPRGCYLTTLQDRYKDNQILLKDIEAHGPVLKSVLRQYERIAAAAATATTAECNKDAADTLQQPPHSSDNPQHKQQADITQQAENSQQEPQDSQQTQQTQAEPEPEPCKEPQTQEEPQAQPPTQQAKEPHQAQTSTRTAKGPHQAPTRTRTGATNNVPRKARSLEKRWHQVYLRSLEWHYYLEGVIANFKDSVSSSCSESEDEPVNKLRRLSTSSNSCNSSCPSSPCPSPSPRPPSNCSSSNLLAPPPRRHHHHHHHHHHHNRYRRWAAYDSSVSEAGSYIEYSPASSCSREQGGEEKDDYVCVSDSGSAPALPDTLCTNPEPMLVDPDLQQQQSKDSPVTPSVNEAKLAPVMVGSVGLDTVLAHCAPSPPPHTLLDTAMIHDSPKTSSNTSMSGDTTDQMENVNQVNGNPTAPSTATEDSGPNQGSPPEAPVTTKSGGVRDSPSRSSCTNVERPSPNCAIFDFKHQDTDTDEAGTTTSSCQANLNLVECHPARNRVIQVRRRSTTTTTTLRRAARTRLEFSCDEEVDHEALQRIIDNAVPDDLDWLNSNMPSDFEYSADEEVHAQEHMDTESDGGTPTQQTQQQEENQKTVEQPQQPSQEEQQASQQEDVQRSMSKESLSKLVCDAERLVRETEGEEPPPIVSPRPHLLPLSGASVASGVGGGKQARVKQWLVSQRRGAKLSTSCVMDSCDASGELTTGESDVESASSDDMDASTATQHATSTRGSHRGSLKGSRDPLPSADNTPTSERLPFPASQDAPQHKVMLRNRKRRSGEQRPWSVSELYQLATRLDLAPYSVSETALHHLLTATPETPTNDNQAFGPMTPKAVAGGSSTTICPTETASPTTTTSSSPPKTTTTTLNTSPSTTLNTSPSTTLNTSPSTTLSASPSTTLNTSLSTSATLNTSLSSSTTVVTSTASGRLSPAAGNTASLRRRKTRARRKSNLSLGRRTDSGSEGITLNLSGGSDNIHGSPCRRLSKSHSSGSDTCSHSLRLVVKSSSFSGGCRAGSGGMTSSTEKCVSDCGAVLGIPRTPPSTRTPPNTRLVHYSTDASRPTSPVLPLALPSRSPLHTARSTSDQDGHNTHEDMSSLSEQAWDPYQEYKYLSEPYSEDLDQEAARRLLDFGDDYRKYIDSDGASSFSGFIASPPPTQHHPRGRRSPHHRRPRCLAPPGPRDLDSDSDLDDLHHVIDQSRSQLAVTENVLKKYSNEAALGLDYAEIVATTQTNIKCLTEIVRHLQMEGTLDPELQEVQSIVQRWEVLQAQAVERQRHSGQTRELQRQVKALRQALEALTDRANELMQAVDVDDREQLARKLEDAKALQQEVKARKVEVSGINLAVHRFLTETGYSLAPLKDDVSDLYRLWDEADRRVNAEVSRLESVEATWKLWESQAEELHRALRQDSDTLRVLDAAMQTGGPLADSVTASVEDVARLLNDRRKTLPGGGKKVLLLQHTKTQGVDIQGTAGTGDLQGSTQSLVFGSGDECLSDSGTSGYESCSSEELSERERRLAHLRRLAHDLEASLHPDSQAWAAVCKTLSSAETELKGLQQHCRELVVRSAGTLDQAKTSPQQIRRRVWNKDNKVGRNGRRGNTSGRDSSGRGGGRKGWMWRVVRAALPFQAALLLLFCVACLLEPNCCDHVNTLNLSLSPQLRYVHGPPPV